MYEFKNYSAKERAYKRIAILIRHLKIPRTGNISFVITRINQIATVCYLSLEERYN